MTRADPGMHTDGARLAEAPGDPADDIAYFLNIPWCRALLRPDEHDPDGGTGGKTHVRVAVPETRRKTQAAARPGLWEKTGPTASNPGSRHNAFANTLNTPDTISHYVVFYEEPVLGLKTEANSLPSPALNYLPPVTELKALMTLGPGLSGHVGVVHGGIVSAILDEVLGLLLPLNHNRLRHFKKQQHQCQPAGLSQTQQPLKAPSEDTAQPEQKRSLPEEAAAASVTVNQSFVTGYLNTTYLKPVRTSTILVTARFTRMEGLRKFYVEGSIRDENAESRAKAEAVFIALQGKL